MTVPLVDLAVRDAELDDLTEIVTRVLTSGFFLLGPELSAFETDLSATLADQPVAGVGSGTDALTLGLRACGIGSGDEVIVPALTAFPTAAAVIAAGAVPVLADVQEDAPLVDPASVRRMLSPRTRAVIAVHLYGLAADVEPLVDLTNGTRAALVEDCAQAQGATFDDGRPVGTKGRFGAFSFYPTKVLGGIGDGGALTSADAELVAEVKAWRSHGERTARYVHELPAGNSRLSELNAAVLGWRLRRLPDRLAALRSVSRRYASELPPHVGYVGHKDHDAPHLAVIRHDRPDALIQALADGGVGAGRHYPRCLADQPALAGVRSDDVPSARRWASTVVSLPLHEGLTEQVQDHVIEVVKAAT